MSGVDLERIEAAQYSDQIEMQMPGIFDKPREDAIEAISGNLMSTRGLGSDKARLVATRIYQTKRDRDALGPAAMEAKARAEMEIETIRTGTQRAFTGAWRAAEESLSATPKNITRMILPYPMILGEMAGITIPKIAESQIRSARRAMAEIDLASSGKLVDTQINKNNAAIAEWKDWSGVRSVKEAADKIGGSQSAYQHAYSSSVYNAALEKIKNDKGMASKLEAISERGSSKEFVDYLSKNISGNRAEKNEAIAMLARKYHVKFNEKVLTESMDYVKSRASRETEISRLKEAVYDTKFSEALSFFVPKKEREALGNSMRGGWIDRNILEPILGKSAVDVTFGDYAKESYKFSTAIMSLVGMASKSEKSGKIDVSKISGKDMAKYIQEDAKKAELQQMDPQQLMIHELKVANQALAVIAREVS